jgi:hypothetical protein
MLFWKKKNQSKATTRRNLDHESDPVASRTLTLFRHTLLAKQSTVAHESTRQTLL